MPNGPNLVGAFFRVGLNTVYNGSLVVPLAGGLENQRAMSPANVAQAIVAAWREAVSPNGILDHELPAVAQRVVAAITDSAPFQQQVVHLVPAAARQVEEGAALRAALPATEPLPGDLRPDPRDALLDSLWGGSGAYEAAQRVDGMGDEAVRRAAQREERDLDL